MSEEERYLCKKDGTLLRKLLIAHNDSNLIDRSYLRYCDKCKTIYLLVPKEIELEPYEIPLLEHQGLTQMEVIE